MDKKGKKGFFPFLYNFDGGVYMSYAVLKGAGYILAHTPHMVLNSGTTQTTERTLNPDSEYLKKVPNHLRSFEDAVDYYPNQVYIGNEHPDVLKTVAKPWYENLAKGSKKEGKMGEIIEEDLFLAFIKLSDVFELVFLTEEFTEKIRPKVEGYRFINDTLKGKLGKGISKEEVERLVNDEHSEGLYLEDGLVGCIKRAHDVDINLSAHVIMENLVSKASAVLAALNLVNLSNINPDDIDYVIECSEEACGDMNQRGGGNFAKSIAEMAELKNATGSDVRGFCAAPAHAMIYASSLVSAGTFKNVMVVAGGSTAKLGMNGKNHVEKGMPVLEDMVAGFAALVSENDGVSPVIRNDITGRHTVQTGSAPQKVMGALVSDPLDRAGMTILDIDKYSTEMQNSDITVPAGAGNVPEANFKMMGALAVQKKQMEKANLLNFIEEHGMEGWAPTQGHIPSGVPYLGFAREDILSGKIKNTMIIGKGSLFLGRMTNLFDGVSFVIEKNTGEAGGSVDGGVSKDEVRQMVGEAMKDFAKSLLEG